MSLRAALFIVHKDRRQFRASSSLNRVPPTSAEAGALHDLFLNYGKRISSRDFVTPEGEERVWMGDTKLEKCLMMFPQERK